MPFGFLKPCLRLRKRTKRIKEKEIFRSFNDTVTPIPQDELVENNQLNSVASALNETILENNDNISSNELVPGNEPASINNEVHESANESADNEETNSPQKSEDLLFNNLNENDISQSSETVIKENKLRNSNMFITDDSSADNSENVSEIELDDLPDDLDEINSILEKRNEIIRKVTVCTNIFETIEEVKALELAAKREFCRIKKNLRRKLKNDEKMHALSQNAAEKHCLTDIENIPNSSNKMKVITKAEDCQSIKYECTDIVRDDSQMIRVISEQSFQPAYEETYNKIKQNGEEDETDKKMNKHIEINEDCFDKICFENNIFTKVDSEDSLSPEYHSNSEKSDVCRSSIHIADTASGDCEISNTSTTSSHKTELSSAKYSSSLNLDIEKVPYFSNPLPESQSGVVKCLQIDCKKHTNSSHFSLHSEKCHSKIDKNLDVEDLPEEKYDTCSKMSQDNISLSFPYTKDYSAAEMKTSNQSISDDSPNSFEEQITSDSGTDQESLTNIEHTDTLTDKDQCNIEDSEEDILLHENEVFTSKNLNLVHSGEKKQNDDDWKHYRQETDSYNKIYEENIEEKRIYVSNQSLKNFENDGSTLSTRERTVEDDDALIFETSNLQSELTNEKLASTHLLINEACTDTICKEDYYCNDQYNHRSEESANEGNYMSDWSGESEKFDSDLNDNTGECNEDVSEGESEKKFEIDDNIARTVSQERVMKHRQYSSLSCSNKEPNLKSAFQNLQRYDSNRSDMFTYDTFISNSERTNQNSQQSKEERDFLKGQCNNRNFSQSSFVFHQEHPMNKLTKSESQESLPQKISDKYYFGDYLSKFDKIYKTPCEISQNVHTLSSLSISSPEGGDVNNGDVYSTSGTNYNAKRWVDGNIDDLLSSQRFEHPQMEREMGLNGIPGTFDLEGPTFEKRKTVIKPFTNAHLHKKNKNVEETITDTDNEGKLNDNEGNRHFQSGDHFDNMSTSFYRNENKLFDSEGLGELEIKRLENIVLFEKRKYAALSEMGPNMRIIPIRKLKILLSSKPVIEREKNRSFKKRIGIVHDKLRDSVHGNEFQENTRNVRLEIPTEYKEKICGRETPESPEIINDSFLNSYDDTSENITPERKRILETSRSIRSPKYFIRMNKPTPNVINPFKRPMFKKRNKVDLVAYMTKDEQNMYQLNKGYKLSSLNFRKRKIVTSERIRPRASDVNKHPNTFACRATSPDDLRTKFDDVFRKYASKGRTNGELISYKKSTEWLKDAGIIGNALSSEEAVDAFKLIAGAKIALNKGDYRSFLRKLSRLKRLNYNEVYERLCTADDKCVASYAL